MSESSSGASSKNTKDDSEKNTAGRQSGNNEKLEKSLSVGAVAERSGVKVSTLHFYEEKGLITSWRNNGNQRRYNRGVLRRVAVIKTAQKLGFTLEEIKTALKELPTNKAPNKADWQKISASWRSSIDQRIQELTQMRDELDQCIGCGCLALEYCPIRNPDDVLKKDGTGAVLWPDTKE